MKIVRAAAVLVGGLILSPTLTGCLVVSYSTGGGWNIWPGSLIVTLLLVLMYLVLRHR